MIERRIQSFEEALRSLAPFGNNYVRYEQGGLVIRFYLPFSESGRLDSLGKLNIDPKYGFNLEKNEVPHAESGVIEIKIRITSSTKARKRSVIERDLGQICEEVEKQLRKCFHN